MDTKQVQAVAHLARIDVSPAELPGLTEEFSRIISYVEQLREVDTTGVTPTACIDRPHDALREDVVTPSLPVETALANAPNAKKGHFAVPKIIG
ncbi:Asp-tRNA(Asn)/Glu-tRNA(Gln) amidotransferase subunit GatC [Chitinivibrio alkaliphilus]|uniref:Aspartyl/glutamyl-tRNA(Asn/Gln) amidotransferase subunit C n=1 Tax=Chitinivibrio alkaliphilus ACht1 TaxID=1313304 RepID=U7D6N8_9BACT|nr:Asp-tRNA(Asn)/Glu-tRNA(Gln) amidotransferase subunit GatC [Chitinivibrio alkaliphilus]ERP31603.1 aspartyl/glutamyl-tRNA amidotransferase subunit C [Chitinivibrio alkaliphilus ACht1]